MKCRETLPIFAVLIFSLSDAYSSQSVAGDVEDCQQFKLDPDRAIKGCSRLLKKSAKGNKRAQAVAHYFLGAAYYQKSLYDQAISNFGEAIKFNPKLAEAHTSLAIAYHDRGTLTTNQGHAQRAVQDLSNAIKYDPDFSEAYVNRGIAYADIGKKDLALADYTKAISIGKFRYDKNGLRNAYHNRGNILGSRREFDKAILDFTQAIKLKPNDAGSYNNRGMTYSFIGKKRRRSPT